MQTKRHNIITAMETVDVSDEEINAFRELAYTASECGVIPFKFSEECDIESMFQLAKLAKKYKKKVPGTLRM